MKILVTGSSGMIGSALVPVLEAAGHDVIALDKQRPSYTQPKKFLCFDLLNDLAELAFNTEGDLFRDIDLIIHLAANARVWELTERPRGALENATTTHNIFEFARRRGVKKIIFASSREVYGNDPDKFPVDEDCGSQRNCESVYAASKIFGECYCHAYKRCYGIDNQIVRFSNVYGKYDNSERFIPKLIRDMKLGKDIVIFGADKELDFTYIDDTVCGILFIVANWPGSLWTNEWNIASGKASKLSFVAERLKAILNSSSKILFEPTRVGEVMKYQANITKMEFRGWKPVVKLEDGLNKAVAYYSK